MIDIEYLNTIVVLKNCCKIVNTIDINDYLNKFLTSPNTIKNPKLNYLKYFGPPDSPDQPTKIINMIVF